MARSYNRTVAESGYAVDFEVGQSFGEPQVSELLGHSSVQTTLSVYQHVETNQFRAPLNEIATELLPDVTDLVASRA